MNRRRFFAAGAALPALAFAGTAIATGKELIPCPKPSRIPPPTGTILAFEEHDFMAVHSCGAGGVSWNSHCHSHSVSVPVTHLVYKQWDGEKWTEINMASFIK